MIVWSRWNTGGNPQAHKKLYGGLNNGKKFEKGLYQEDHEPGCAERIQIRHRELSV